jgi:hypothetical protein
MDYKEKVILRAVAVNLDAKCFWFCVRLRLKRLAINGAGDSESTFQKFPLLKHEECGNLLVALIFVPIANGHFEFFNPALAAGGKL